MIKMNEERITEILSKIKNTVGENNYKLALAITGHRPGKIKDVLMSSKDGELLLEYITKLQNNWNELKRFLEEKMSVYEHKEASNFYVVLNKMQELQGEGNNDNR